MNLKAIILAAAILPTPIRAANTIAKKVGTFLDSMAVSGVDRHYIDAPQRPWQVMIKGNVNQTELKMNSTIHHSEDIFYFLQGDMTWEPKMETEPSTYVGFWAGYRGYGLGYSWNVGGDKGRILTFGATGGCYGVNLRIHRFESDDPQVYFEGNGVYTIAEDGETLVRPFSTNEVIELGSPIKTRSLFLDGHYLFNGKKCSYAAAYDQSVIQKHSAGSIMAGAMYFHSTTSYDTNDNADLILFMNDIGRIKTWQASSGVGYIYNWVPAHGLLISAMAIPMVTFYNHIKIWRYASNLKEEIKNQGMGGISRLDENDYQIWPQGRPRQMRSQTRLNFDARLSLTYEWNERIFMNAVGQFNNFRFKTDDFNGRLNDWFVNASIGIRL